MENNLNTTFAMYCYDPRQTEQTDEYDKQHYPNRAKHDYTRFPGGVGNKAAFQEALTIAVKKHGVSEATLGVHEDCAYGATIEDLQEAARFASGLGIETVTLVYFKLDGTHEVIAEEAHSSAVAA